MMLSVLDVFTVAGGTIDKGKIKGWSKRLILEGEAYYNSQLLYGVGKREQHGDIYLCEGLAAQTSAVHSSPHKILIKFDKSKDVGERVLSIECSCIAGASEKCKHAVATVFWLTRHSEEEFHDLSCTDVEQVWDKLKTKGGIHYEGCRLNELCHSGKKTDVYSEDLPVVTEDMRKKWRDRLLKCKSSS